ncbi:hypothetical protein Ddc_17823 [Ditylenchus destructor]|nr:hypothetical protein Ddc_17823 [Ditylenchus destructor]
MTLGSNASDGIIASATSLPTPSESPPLKHAKWPSRQIESRELKSSIASQKSLEVEGMPLKLHLRGRKQVHCWEGDFEAGQNMSVERKRIRLSRTGSYTNDAENSNFDSNANRDNFLETDISETESQNMPNSNTCVPLQTVRLDNTNIQNNDSLKRRLDKLFETVNGLKVQDPTLCLANKLLTKLEDTCNVFIKKPPRIPKNTPECVRQRRFYERHKEELNEKRKSTNNITEEQMKKLAPKETFNVKETSIASKENISGNEVILSSFQLLKRC